MLSTAITHRFFRPGSRIFRMIFDVLIDLYKVDDALPFHFDVSSSIYMLFACMYMYNYFLL